MPDALSARVPAEQRGSGRADVRLLLTRGTEVSHHVFGELAGRLRAGDVLVVNTSRTLPAAVDARLGGERLVVHFSTLGDDGRWAVELRTPGAGGREGVTVARAGGPAGAVVRLPGGGHLVLEEPLDPAGTRLWWAVPRGGVRTGAAGPPRPPHPLRVHGARPAAVGVPDGLRAPLPRRFGFGGDA